MRSLFGLCIGILLLASCALPTYAAGPSWWSIQSIDTMKYSRDLAKQVLDDPNSFADVIDFQVKAIAATGATHVGIGTPYDEKYLPVLKMWVQSARQHNIKVWFRGNFAGWEGWFETSKIDRETHKKLLKEFLDTHADLFEEGDIFSSCPECENGGPGNPWNSGGVENYRTFLIDEYVIAKTAFFRMGKNVTPNLHSMNFDVAKAVLDENTTRNIGGYVVIDHYVKDPKTLVEDVQILSQQTKGKIIFGEFGTPIPDINGEMTEKEQADWIDEALRLLSLEKSVVGVNYWVGTGGSTQIWNEGGSPRAAVEVIRRYFSPPAASGIVYGRDNAPLTGVTVKTPWKIVLTDSEGKFALPLSSGDTQISVFAAGYHSQNLTISPLGASDLDIRMEKEQYSLFDRIKLWLQRWLSR